MQATDRQRIIALCLVLVVGLFAADRLALSPFLEMRQDLLTQRAAGEKDLAEARRTLQQEIELRPLKESMNTSISAEPSAVESQLLHLMHQWQQRAGVGNASFQRLHAVDSHGFTCLTFNVSATGGMGAVAALLYELETASIPLRIDDIRLAPKREGGDELQLRLNVSTICRGSRPESPHTASVAASGGAQW